MESFRQGPSIGDEFSNHLLEYMDKYKEIRNTYEMALTYGRKSSCSEENALAQWYAEMYYLAGRQNTLSESLEFRDILQKDLGRIIAAWSLGRHFECDGRVECRI